MLSNEVSTVDESCLPDDYDKLISVEKLRHGEHNPRRVRPKEELRRSIQSEGINRALIARPARDSELFHITDGWQRYQAATELGWEALPVRLYETALEALEATETESIVREWSTYEWARHCKSVSGELSGNSQHELAQKVSERTTKSPQTVNRYLDVLSLPSEIHPLLHNGPDGSNQDWAALENYNSEIRRYDGLRWQTAARLARNTDGLSRNRVVGIAANAVRFREPERAKEFIDEAAANPAEPLEQTRKRIDFGQACDKYLKIPRTSVRMGEEDKEAVMEYCSERRKPLSEIVEETVKEIAKKGKRSEPAETSMQRGLQD